MEIADDQSYLDGESICSLPLHVNNLPKDELLLAGASIPKLPVMTKSGNGPLYIDDPSVCSNEDSLGEFSILQRDVFATGNVVGETGVGSNSPVSTIGGTNAVDEQFSFKVVDSGGHIHRIRTDVGSIDKLLSIVASKLGGEVVPSSLQLKYIDDEGDAVVIGTDECLSEAVDLARNSGNNVLKLLVLKSSQLDESQKQAILIGGAIGLSITVLLGILLLSRRS